MGDEILLRVRGFKKYFLIKTGFWHKTTKLVHAVDNVNLDIKKGEVLGLVGESGCGKSTLAMVIVGIYPPTEGVIELEGVDISRSFSRNDLSIKRKMQIVFQDPFWSLDPRMIIRNVVCEPLEVHKITGRNEFTGRVGELLEMVGISKSRMFSYPHEFSGGERQRISIARALALTPKMLLLDEPTSSIDTISQAEILNLLLEIRSKFNLSYLLISHDLSVIYYLSDRIAVMYLGKIVEIGRTQDVFEKMYHPYTQALMKAVPVINKAGEVQKIAVLEGDVPSAITPPLGCRFNTRCYKCQDICKVKEPELRDYRDEHFAACHFVNGV